MGFKVFPILCVSALIYVVRGDLTYTPCKRDDKKCVETSKSEFLSRTSHGIPEYDIRPIDPVIMSYVDYETRCEPGLMFHFKNIFVTGFKDQLLLDFNMDTEKQEVLFTSDADINIFGDVIVDDTKNGKIFNGALAVSGNVAFTGSFRYIITKDFLGVKHFQIEPENFNCQVFGKPKILFSSELDHALNADPKAREIRRKDQKTLEIRKELLCKITEELYFVYIHNLREATRILPTTSFIKQ